MLDLSRILFLWVNITNSLRDDGIIQRWGGQWVIGGEEKDVVESGRKASEWCLWVVFCFCFLVGFKKKKGFLTIFFTNYKSQTLK